MHIIIFNKTRKQFSLFFFITADMTYCDRYIIKVVLVVNPSKSYITPITTDYINNCEKYYVHSIAQFAKTNFKRGIK